VVHCNLHDVCKARHSPCLLRIMPQVRVMPNCWYLLVRFFLRVDRMFVRLREARLFCDLRQVQRRWHNHFIRAA
jgi:TIP41-like family